MANGTLSFSSNLGSPWLDGVAVDGEGGSADLANIVIQVGLISDADGAALNLPIEWRNNTDLANEIGFNGLTTFDASITNSGWAGFVIKSADGSEFQINSFQWFDWGNWDGESVHVIGYRDGQQVASSSFLSNIGDSISTYNPSAAFDRVDEIRITYADGAGWGAINNIEIADPPPPKVVTVSSPDANRSYKAGDVILLTVTFDQAVDINSAGGAPTLRLETGSVDHDAVYTGGSGTTTLTFQYTVQAGDTSFDLDYGDTSALQLNGATVKLAGGTTNAVLTLPSPGAAGSLGANKAMVIDTFAPTLTISTSSSTLKVGESATVTFTFSEDPGTSFDATDIVVSGGTIGPVSGSGLTRVATFTPTPNLDNGSASITVAAGLYADAAGNPGGAGASPSITFDTRPPIQPAMPVLDPSSDSGQSSTDTITTVTVPTFIGAANSAEAGATLRLYDGATLIAATTVNSDGSWSVTSAAALSNGVHAITAKVTDAGGNVSVASDPLTVNIDTVAPPAPSTPDLNASSDTGISNSDNITGNTTPTFIGTAENGATVTLYDGATAIGSAVAVGGAWSITSSELTQGSHSITAKVTDLAGNQSSASSALTIQVLTDAPATSVGSMAFSADTGDSSTDFVTRVAAQTISGTLAANLAAGERVEISFDGGGNWTTASSAAGSNSWSLAALLATGTHTIAVRVANAVDNGGPIYLQDYTLDTVAPSVTITSSASQLKAGESATITFTFSEDPGSSFSWDGSAGDIVVTGGVLSAISGTGLTRTAVFTPDAGTNGGAASIAINSGSYSDLAGNSGMAGTTPSLTFDTLIPNVPSAPVLASSSDSGVSDSDNITSRDMLILTGTAESGALVQLYDSDGVTVIGSGTATGGLWSITTSALSAGNHVITARAVDAAGNTSMTSAPLTVFVDSAAPTLVQTSPSTGATNVSTLAGLALTFSEAVLAGLGTIELHSSDGALVESFNVGASSRVQISGNVVTIDPTLPLGSGLGYYLTVSAGAFIDAAGHVFAGVADSGMITFTTSAIVNPTVTQNERGGQNIFVTDLSQITSDLGTGNVDHLFYSGSGTFVLPGNIENLSLTGGAANVQANGLDNMVRAGAGNDTVDSGAGRDTISGGAGHDHLAGGTSSDRISGGTGSDVVDGGSGNDAIFGDTGNDTIYGGVGSDRVSGGSGRDFISGGTGNDRLSGGAGNDHISGGSGNDSVHGGAGNDRVYGDGGHDTVHGSFGNDTIYGGTGNDMLSGGAGRDVFVFDTQFDARSNVDTIRDFAAGEDSIWLNRAIFADLGFGGEGRMSLSASALVYGTVAQDAQDRIVYDRLTGSLYYDRDGTGTAAQVKFAAVAVDSLLTYHDFFIV